MAATEESLDEIYDDGFGVLEPMGGETPGQQAAAAEIIGAVAAAKAAAFFRRVKCADFRTED